MDVRDLRPVSGAASELETARRRFERWRRIRKRGERIPKSLWASAVRVAESCGVDRTAAILRVAGERLLQHMEASRETDKPNATTPGPAAFVELPSAMSIGSECVLELEDADGLVMRVRLTSSEAPDLAAMIEGFRNTRS